MNSFLRYHKILWPIVGVLAVLAVVAPVLAEPPQVPGVSLTWGDFTVDSPGLSYSRSPSPLSYRVSFNWANGTDWSRLHGPNMPVTVSGVITGDILVFKTRWLSADKLHTEWCVNCGVAGVYIGGSYDPSHIVTSTTTENSYQFDAPSQNPSLGLGDPVDGSFRANAGGYWSGSKFFDFVVWLYSVNGEVITDDPLSPPVATPIPQGALPCITATVSASATVQPTMTPYGRATPTPAPTRTPGGPTPTPTATHAPISGTVSYDSGLISFDTGISQLSAVGVVNNPGPNQFVSWSDATGYDGRPGVAMMHAGMGDVLTVTAQEMISGSVVAVFKTGGYVGPVAVSLYARTAYTLTQGGVHSLRVWYLDPDYGGPGNGAWVTNQVVPSSLVLSNVWRKFGAVVQPAGGSGRISAIALSDERTLVDLGESLPPCPSGRGCIYIDDLRIAYGAAAGMVLPICDGTDPYGANGRNNRGSKTCIINITTIDLQAACTAPTTLDFGAWLSYFWCRLWRFFGFFIENTQQVDAIIARQSANEPFGSMFETGAVYDDLSGQVDNLRAHNKSQAQTPIDWVYMFMDGSALDWDRLAQFSVPDIAGAAQYMAGCPQEVIDINISIGTGACMALYMMRQTIIVGFLQWGLNALFVVGILMMVRSDLEKLAS